MLTPTRRHPWTSVSQLFKYNNHNKYEILISEDKNVSTHKLWNQPFSSLSSYLMRWMDSLLISFFQQTNWKLVFHVIIKFDANKNKSMIIYVWCTLLFRWLFLWCNYINFFYHLLVHFFWHSYQHVFLIPLFLFCNAHYFPEKWKYHFFLINMKVNTHT